MSHLNRGLFDPRQKMVEWPEPNDDPNIPYVWGLNGYPRSNPPASSVSVSVRPVPPNAPASGESEILKGLAGAAITLGILGLYEGYTNSSESELGARVFDSLSKGAIYATGVGFVVSKLKG